MLENALNFGSYTTVALNVAFRSGSSKHGRDIRAKIDSNCVPAMYLYTHNDVILAIAIYGGAQFSTIYLFLLFWSKSIKYIIIFRMVSYIIWNHQDGFIYYMKPSGWFHISYETIRMVSYIIWNHQDGFIYHTRLTTVATSVIFY